MSSKVAVGTRVRTEKPLPMTRAASIGAAERIPAPARNPPATARTGLVACAIQVIRSAPATRAAPGIRASTGTASTPASARPEEMPAGAPDQALRSEESPW